MTKSQKIIEKMTNIKINDLAFEITEEDFDTVVYQGTPDKQLSYTEFQLAFRRSEINDERDRRIERGFAFNGGFFQFDIKSKTNISGAAQMAFMAIVSGAEQGDLRWHGGGDDFTWIDAENNSIPMDAQTVVAFGQVAAGHERAHLGAARALKNQEPIPDDYQNDKYWP